MIEVIGKDPSKYAEHTCYKCASILRFTLADIKKSEFNHDYLGDFDVCDSIVCPVCATLLEV